MRFFVAHKAMIVNPKGEILLVREGTGDDTNTKVGLWCAPGGRMEAGESPMEAFRREILEEVGIEISDPRPITVHEWRPVVKGEQWQVIAVYYLIKVGDVILRLSKEHDEFKWLDPRKVKREELTKEYYATIQKYLAQEFGQPVSDPSILGRQGYGLIQLYHGHGKGKTTAGLGSAIRAAGAGKKVGIVYFDKGGNTHYSERSVLDKIDNIDYFVTGRDRIDEKGRFDFSIIDEDKIEARRGLRIAKDLLKGEYDLIVLDEINSTVALGMLEVENVIKVIDERSQSSELILTGRDPAPELIDRAHLVTEMKPQKHYFYSGVKAREGLDF